MKTFQIPGQADRRWLIALLLLTNVVLELAANAGLACLDIQTVAFRAWTITLILGHIVAQIVMLAYWFSFSGDKIWFRLAMVLATIVPSCLGATILAAGVQFAREPEVVATLADFFRSWVEVTATMSVGWLIYILAAYALLLPIRRLRGMSLASQEPLGEALPARRQFLIYEWMIWSAIVASPLALWRLLTSEDSDDFGGPTIVQQCLMLLGMLVIPLLLGWPVFRAALARRYALLWTLAVLLSFVVAGWLVSEVVYQLKFQRQNPVLTLWPLEAFFLSFAANVSLNACALRWLGFRVVVDVLHQPEAQARVPDR